MNVSASLLAALLAQQQQAYGKALEYAVAAALIEALQARGAQAALTESDAARTAARRYAALPVETRAKYDLGARAGVRLVAQLEATLQTPGPTRFDVRIQADAQGAAGDVRDVVVTTTGGWTLGVSVKHNNDVAKNPRLARTLDFCQHWTEHPCDALYFAAVKPTFSELEQLTAVGAHWSSLNLKEEEKGARFYRPVMQALAAQLERLARQHADAPAALVTYFLGRQDFYKLIVSMPERTTTVQAFSFAGTLARPADARRQTPGAAQTQPVVAQLPLPTRLQTVAFKPRSDNTIILTFDQNWTFTLRLHNASAHVEASLKLDVRMTSAPPTLVKLQERW
ncbi:MAG TPA: HaeIII family restriction endonuclease [Pyrinomonadaceae bacterium]|nr:HaeIII family restriction endonuclease [Pyrinomonadaceae bacterium]